MNVQLFGLYNWALAYRFSPATIVPYTQILRYVRLEAYLLGGPFDFNLKATRSITLLQLQTQTTTNFLRPRVSLADGI